MRHWFLGCLGALFWVDKGVGFVNVDCLQVQGNASAVCSIDDFRSYAATQDIDVNTTLSPECQQCWCGPGGAGCLEGSGSEKCTLDDVPYFVGIRKRYCGGAPTQPAPPGYSADSVRLCREPFYARLSDDCVRATLSPSGMPTTSQVVNVTGHGSCAYGYQSHTTKMDLECKNAPDGCFARMGTEFNTVELRSCFTCISRESDAGTTDTCFSNTTDSLCQAQDIGPYRQTGDCMRSVNSEFMLCYNGCMATQNMTCMSGCQAVMETNSSNCMALVGDVNQQQQAGKVSAGCYDCGTVWQGKNSARYSGCFTSLSSPTCSNADGPFLAEGVQCPTPECRAQQTRNLSDSCYHCLQSKWDDAETAGCPVVQGLNGPPEPNLFDCGPYYCGPTNYNLTWMPPGANTSAPTAAGATTSPTGANATQPPTPANSTTAPTAAGATTAPTAANSTTAPTVAGATAAPSTANSTTPPTTGTGGISASKSPTVTGATGSPTVTGATKAPTPSGATTAPTAAGGTGAPTAPRGNTGSPSAVQTLAPSVSPVGQPPSP
eukprot:Hpha_TRINITY_DN30067_c0_g1::TRINITY_DN30067_c0_g1_i1::g.21491::m.21491